MVHGNGFCIFNTRVFHWKHRFYIRRHRLRRDLHGFKLETKKAVKIVPMYFFLNM